MKQAITFISLFVIVALLLAASGCTQQSAVNTATQQKVWIVYASEKGDLSYTDSAYKGLLAAQKELSFTTKEFTLAEHKTVPGLLRNATGTEKPDLVITIGFQYDNFTRQLAGEHPDIRFFAIDQPGIGSGNINAYEISSYGDSYLAGVLAASATKTGQVGIILGMQTALLDTFLEGYTAGVHAANSSVTVDSAYVQQNSTDGFRDPVRAGRIAEGMYRNGTDVIYACAGLSNTGAIDAAKNADGRYIIGTDSDQSPLGSAFVLASAVKRMDRIVYTGIADEINGTFTGGDHVAGLKEGATGMVYNPKFAHYNTTVSSWQVKAEEEEAKYLVSGRIPGRD